MKSQPKTHNELCLRAVQWLRGTRRCNPVYSLNASCAEIPDAIGWSSTYGWRGSTVIECKTSIADFYADQRKRFRWGLKTEVSRMGDYRFYLCEPGIITPELVANKAPDHGLIYRYGHAMKIVIPAPRRETVDKDSEIRYLRFAIINGKTGREIEEHLAQKVLQF